MSTSREDAIRQIARAAVECERLTAMPAEILAGMCALESGWLRSAPGNNAFGMKFVQNRHKGKQLLTTREWLKPEDIGPWTRRWPGRQVLGEESGPDARGRRLYRVRDYFAAYDSLEAAMLDFSRLMSTPRYAPAIASYMAHRGIRRAVRDIAAAGYTTTDPDQYADRVMRVLAGPLEQAIDAERSARSSMRT